MARPFKPGLDYYNTDTDRYFNRKIKRLVYKHGYLGLVIYDYLLAEVYRDKGCFAKWDEDLSLDICRYFGVKEEEVGIIVVYLAGTNLFDNKVFHEHSILTSQSIQERYALICRAAKRKSWSIPSEIKLIQEETELTLEETPVSDVSNT